jgi:hypothetical protein
MVNLDWRETKMIKNSDEKCIHLPVAIGDPIYVPYRFKDTDGTINEGVEVLHLSGYVNEDGREFYLTYDEFGTNDIPIANAYVTRAEAEERLKNDKGEI